MLLLGNDNMNDGRFWCQAYPTEGNSSRNGAKASIWTRVNDTGRARDQLVSMRIAAKAFIQTIPMKTKTSLICLAPRRRSDAVPSPV